MPSTPDFRKIGRYEILAEIGRGGMGVVYRARDPIINRIVALKTIRNLPDLGAEARAQYAERFIREAQAAGSLVHPGIVTVYDAGHDAGTGLSFIAMEYVEGTTVEAELHGGRIFTPREIARIGAVVADALHFAHRKGIVHRDIKPANLLLDEAGRVKIADFGVARLPESTLTLTGQFVGTPHYMSPELVTGQVAGPRSDLFSLGVVLYQMATRTMPFQGDSVGAIVLQILKSEPPAPRTLNSAVPEGLEYVILKALAKDPRDRYEDGAAMTEDFKHLDTDGAAAPTGRAEGPAAPEQSLASTPMTRTLAGADETVAAAVPAPAPADTPGSRRPRRAWLPVAGIAVAGFIAVVVALWGLSHTELNLPLKGFFNPGPARVDALISEGQALYNRGAYADCVDRMEKALEIDPGNARARKLGEDAQDAMAGNRRAPPAGAAGRSEPTAGPEPEPTEEPGQKNASKPASGEGESTLIVRFDHHISSGSYSILLDGKKIHTGALRARKTREIIPKVKVSRQEIEKTLAVPSGKHRVEALVTAQDPKINASEGLYVTFESGKSQAVRIEVERLTKRLKVRLE